jgi:gamma-glutamyltranspeptidase / glutathione hydrolase
MIDYGMNIQQAIETPRFHYQGIPDAIDIEPLALPFATTINLKLLGYHLTQQGQWSAVEAIYIDPHNGILYGINDDRRPDGKATGN